MVLPREAVPPPPQRQPLICFSQEKGKQKLQLKHQRESVIHPKSKISAWKREKSAVLYKKTAEMTRDVTSGSFIYAAVCAETEESGTLSIHIDGGEGVGRVTKPGLDQPVGNAAINHVPREMIAKEVGEICRLLDYKGRIEVEISVPGGEELAKQTFNPRLGITGGISILGTSGIVEPMSNQAIKDTIRVELNQRKVQGYDYVAGVSGKLRTGFYEAVLRL